MSETLRGIRELAVGHRPGRWLLLLALALVVAALEAIGALLVLGLLALLADPSAVAASPLLPSGWLPDPSGEPTGALLGVGLAIVVFFVLRGAVVLLHQYLQYRTVETTCALLSARLFAGYLAMPATFHLSRNSAESVRNTIDGVNRFRQDGLVPALQATAKLATVGGIVLVLLAVSPWAALAAVAVLVPLAWVIARVIHPRIERLGRTAHELALESLRSVYQSLDGWRDIRILGRADAFVDRFTEHRLQIARTFYLHSTMAQVPRVGIETGMVVFIVAFIALSAVARGTAGALPVLGLFGYAAVRLIPELNQIAQALASLRFVGPVVTSLRDDLARADAPTQRPHDPDRPARPVVPLPLEDAIELRGVAFRYPEGSGPVLDEVDLRIEAGSSLGIVGPTGGGKSTLVDLLLGILDPTRGSITVDGVDIHDDLPAWHANVGMVPQSVFLIDDTLRANIALGIPDDEVDEEALAEAVRAAQLESFVSSLPAQLDTVVGERGTRISGGQRQRVALARALYRRPGVLVLDEGTSALDRATEAAVLEGLRARPGHPTILTVAHHVEPVAGCDQVILVTDGGIADRGRPAELAARHPQLWGGGA